MEQSPLCSATLLYIHSLIGVREEKRWKMCEKEGFPAHDPTSCGMDREQEDP